MKPLLAHVTRCLIAGVVALLPVGGTLLGVAYVESALSSSWLARQWFYFPGCGILLAVVLLYVVGLAASTFLGRWLWTRFDRLLDHLPLVGSLYQTLKQILGYAEGEDAVFRQVVLVPTTDGQALEIGLVTSQMHDAQGELRQVVFVPAAPTPTTGRLVVIEPSKLVPLSCSVSDALKAQVSVGKSEIGSVGAAIPNSTPDRSAD